MDQVSFEVSIFGETYPAHYIKEKETAANVLEQLMHKDVLFGIDTETRALSQYRMEKNPALSPLLSRIRLLQVFDGKNSLVFDLDYIKDDSIFIPFLEAKRFVAHNAIFDLGFFKKMGVTDMNIGCTYILSKLLFHAIYPTDEGLNAGLAEMVNVVFKEKILKVVQNSDWGVLDLTYEQVEYAALDAICVLKLAEKLAPGLEKYGLTRIYQLTKAAQHPICDLQLNGITIDVTKHRALIDTWRSELYVAKKAVLQMTALDEVTGHKLAGWLEENLDEDTLVTWPRTDTGKLSTDSHTFADFDYLPIVKPFSEFQKREKLTSSFGMKLLAQINKATGRVHASYRLAGARTGRLSSSSPNLQQLPRDKAVRKNFIAPSGYTFLCADYSQIELRVAAEVSRDPVMLSAFEDGIDLHKLTASKVSGKPMHEIADDSPERQMAKAVNFGLLFGLGHKKFSHYAKKSYKVEVSEEEARGAVKAFRETYKGYYKWQMEQATNAQKTKECRTPCGKLRRLPDDNTYGNSMNHPVQGGAAECMLYALVNLHEGLKGLPAKLVNVVHDEVLIEVKNGYEEAVKEIIKDSMVRGFLSVFPDGITNGIVEVLQGPTWGQAKEKPKGRPARAPAPQDEAGQAHRDALR